MKVAQEIETEKVPVKAVLDEYSIARPIVSRWVSEYRRYGKKLLLEKEKDILTKLISIFWNKKIRSLKREITFYIDLATRIPRCYKVYSPYEKRNCDSAT